MSDALKLAEYLATREGFVCPKCHGTHFGTTLGPKEEGYLVIGWKCHDEHGNGCKWRGTDKSECFRKSEFAAVGQALLEVKKLLDGFDQLVPSEQNSISGFWVAVQIRRALEAK